MYNRATNNCLNVILYGDALLIKYDIAHRGIVVTKTGKHTNIKSKKVIGTPYLFVPKYSSTFLTI